MSTGKTIAARLAISLIAFGGLATACTSGPGEVSKSDVEKQTADQLAAKVKEPAPAITCPGPLAAKMGTAMDCTLVAQGSTAKYNVHLAVDSVKDSNVHWSIEVAKYPIGDKAAFCDANSKIDAAAAKATTPADVAQVLKTTQPLLQQFKDNAPPDIRPDAEKLVAAAAQAADAGDASGFADPAIQASGKKVDAYCGQNPDGTPASASSSSSSSTPTTAAP